MTPEINVRKAIDQKLEHADWIILGTKQLNLAAGVSVAIQKYKTDSSYNHNAQLGTAFTHEQTHWRHLIKDHIASSCSISRDDFDYVEIVDKDGLQKARGLFGKDLHQLMDEMNMELIA
jgi:hypothetical protein